MSKCGELNRKLIATEQKKVYNVVVREQILMQSSSIRDTRILILAAFLRLHHKQGKYEEQVTYNLEIWASGRLCLLV